MKKVSILLNTIYAYLLQLSGLLIPLLTAPILSRVLGANLLGKVAYTNSIAIFFTTVATFCTTAYGFREVARVRNDRKELSKLYSEVMYIKAVFSGILILVYFPFSVVLSKSYGELPLLLIQGLLLVFNVFSIDWFFQGMEDYKYVTIRTLAVRVVSVTAIFLFVKDKQGYLLFALISVFALAANNILNIFYVKKFVDFSILDLKLRRHFKTLLIFLISSIVISIYGVLDQILLGSIKSAENVAFFSRAKMILMASMALSSTVINVFTVRLTNYHANERKKYALLLSLSRNVVLLISLPVAVGIFLLSGDIMFLLGGAEFAGAENALKILAVLCIIVPLGSWNYSQRLLPQNLERFGLFAQIIMACISVIANIVLIPRIGFIGASIAYVLAESSGTIIGMCYIHRKDPVKFTHTSTLKALTAVAIMSILIIFLSTVCGVSWLSLLVKVAIGTLSYIAVLVIIRESLVIEVLGWLKKRIIITN